jgi:Smr domain
MSDARDAFVIGLEGLLSAFEDLSVETLAAQPLRVAIELSLPAGGATCLPVTVTIAPHEITVELGGWTRGLERSGPDDEDAAALALDLVAIALLGRAQVLRTVLRDHTAIAHEVAFLGPRGFVAFDRVARWRWPWQAVTTEVLRNAARVPAGLALGSAGMLPHAPWSGTLALPEPGADARALPIDGELDLHNFAPKEVDPLVRAYIDECLARGILHLRIVHGKGTGALRRTVQAILSRHPAVVSQRLGGHREGSWGATIVTLRADAAPER